ncbi:Nn.00g104840.m01.CDS01 [Neocucurbitaria sp. VM-36]
MEDDGVSEAEGVIDDVSDVGVGLGVGVIDSSELEVDSTSELDDGAAELELENASELEVDGAAKPEELWEVTEIAELEDELTLTDATGATGSHIRPTGLVEENTKPAHSAAWSHAAAHASAEATVDPICLIVAPTSASGPVTASQVATVVAQAAGAVDEDGTSDEDDELGLVEEAVVMGVLWMVEEAATLLDIACVDDSISDVLSEIDVDVASADDEELLDEPTVLDGVLEKTEVDVASSDDEELEIDGLAEDELDVERVDEVKTEATELDDDELPDSTEKVVRVEDCTRLLDEDAPLQSPYPF